MPKTPKFRALVLVELLFILVVAFHTAGRADAQPTNTPVSPPSIPESLGSAYNTFQTSYWRDFATPYYKEQLRKERLNVGAMDSQAHTGPLILMFVMIIVSVGLALSVLQFVKGVWLANTRTSAGDNSQFSANLQGVEIKSSSIGLLILTVSLVFFYVYIKYVYTITVLK
jgi:hypothetical protein